MTSAAIEPFKPKSSSISQRNTFESCRRKWAFSSVDYLPQTERRSTACGSATHDELEIYLDVDENGLSRRTGKEPVMYQKGWEYRKNYFKTQVIFVLSPKEQSMIKQAIQMGIDQSVVVREPNAVVEFEKRIYINEHLYFTLKIDYAYGFNIEDHKTCKDFRFTTVDDPKHERYVGNDDQLRIYAYFWAQEYSKMSGEPIPEYISVCHNQFMINPAKAKPIVKKVKGKVKYSDCEKTWNEVKASALEQLDYRLKIHNGELKSTKVPRDISACGAYGGCPFKSVCMAQESPKAYTKRIKLKVKELTLQIEAKEEVMGFDLGNGATSEQASVLQDIEGTETTTENVTPQEEKPTLTPPPRSAKVIKAAIKKLKDPLLAAGMLEEAINAMPNVAVLLEELAPIEEADKAEKARIAKEKREAKKKLDEEKKAKEEAEAKAEAEKEAKESAVKFGVNSIPDPNVEKAEPGDFTIKKLTKSRSKGITVLIDCYPAGGVPCDYIRLQEIFALKSAQMAHEAGVANYYALDPFKRKDLFREAKDNLISELEGYTIIACGYSHEEQALLNALMEDRNVTVYSGR